MTAMATSALSRVTLPGGLRLQYAERGRGPAILFLHGFGDSWYSFDAVMRRLPDDVRALARPSAATATPTARRLATESRTSPATRWRSWTRPASRPRWSLAIRWGVSSRRSWRSGHPERVSRLVLVGSGTEFDNPTVRELADAIGALRDPVSREFVREFQAGCVHHPIPADVFDAIVAESLKLPARVWQAVIPASSRAGRGADSPSCACRR